MTKKSNVEADINYLTRQTIFFCVCVDCKSGGNVPRDLDSLIPREKNKYLGMYGHFICYLGISPQAHATAQHFDAAQFQPQLFIAIPNVFPREHKRTIVTIYFTKLMG